MEKLVVYIADDDPDSLEVCCRLLVKAGYTPKTFLSGTELLLDQDIESAACLILDNQMPGMSGLEVQHELKQRGSDVPILFVSGASFYSDVVNALQNGALNFLQKPVSFTTLIEQVELAISEGEQRRNQKKQQANWEQLLGTLTAREREIYKLIISGHTNKMISLLLGISVSTVEFHRSNLRTKLGVNTLAEMMALANSHSS